MVQVSGNEFISLPNISETNGSVQSITTLSMDNRGMFEICGEPLLNPIVKINDTKVNLDNSLVWDRECYWIPKAKFINDNYNIILTYLTPQYQKAVAFRIEVINKSSEPIKVDSLFEFNWVNTYHVVNERYQVNSTIEKKRSNWNHDYIYQHLSNIPLICLAPIIKNNKDHLLNPNEKSFTDFYLGFGIEEVSAATAAKHLLRIGFDNLFNQLTSFLKSKIIKLEDSFLEMVLNTNLFFTYFYSSGITLDTEELVLVTSRSPRYYVSAAYWDRDSLFWSFPSFLLFDKKFSKQVLKYVFTKQIKNIGEHSRFIDGCLLEPGFELDQLCALVIALNNYIDKTKDYAFLEQDFIKDGLLLIYEKLKTKRNKNIALYETFLMPTDDFTQEKYLTYDNVLVWKTLKILSEYLNDENLLIESFAVEKAIYKHLVKNEMFVWSSDLDNQFSIYDEPPGSLLLLNYFGFCDKSSKIWNNTVKHIRSKDYSLSFAQSPISEIGCNHAPHPWILSLCNSLLCGFGPSAIKNLKKMKMDNYIACESVNEESGECTSGEAFATCAGFLAYSLNCYLN